MNDDSCSLVFLYLFLCFSTSIVIFLVCFYLVIHKNLTFVDIKGFKNLNLRGKHYAATYFSTSIFSTV